LPPKRRGAIPIRQASRPTIRSIQPCNSDESLGLARAGFGGILSAPLEGYLYGKGI
jgi:hypothetical protein